MEKRRRTLVPASKDVTLFGPGGEDAGTLVNLSLKGCLLRCQSIAALEPRDAPDPGSIEREMASGAFDLGSTFGATEKQGPRDPWRPTPG